MDPADTDADAVLVAARARGDALAAGDGVALAALLHERFTWTSHRGDVLDRDTYVGRNTGGTLRWHAQRLDDVHVDVVGDTAVLRCEVHDVVVVDGAPTLFAMPMTQTWVRLDGRWLCLAGHAGPLR